MMQLDYDMVAGQARALGEVEGPGLRRHKPTGQE